MASLEGSSSSGLNEDTDRIPLSSDVDKDNVLCGQERFFLSGTLGLSIGICGRAIVVWTSAVCGFRGGHCTILWQKSGFDEMDVRYVVDLRREFIGTAKRVSFYTKGGPRATRDPCKIRYDVDEKCDLFKFAEFVRGRVDNDWVRNIADPTIHVTTFRTNVETQR